MRRTRVRLLLISLVVFSLVTNTILGLAVITDYDHIGQLVHTVLLVKGKALFPVSFGKMIDGAASGVVKSLQDPYSVYLSPDDYSQLQGQIEGIFGGVGLILDTSKESQLEVQGVIKDSPADKAGLRKGDIVTAVDGQKVSAIKAKKATDLMKGPVGTEVTLTVRKADGQERDYTIKRELINLKSVETKLLQIPQRVAYIKLNSFTEQTPKDLANSLTKLSGAKGVILDLRDNPGGSLESVVEIGKYFLPKGPVVHLVNRNGTRETYLVNGGGLRLPLVVLVNHGTASASEILAGAVQDTASGLVVGTQTYGKGVVQTIYGLGQNAGLKLTTAKYLTPLGRDINKVGLRPDVVVEDSSHGDAVLTEGLKLLRERIQE